MVASLSYAKNADIVMSDRPIGRNKSQILNVGLRDQHAIERVRVMPGQGGGGHRMGRKDWQEASTQPPRDGIELVDGKHETPGRALDRDLPDSGTTDEELIFGRQDRISYRLTNTRRFGGRPYDDMSIEQQVQGNWPSKAA